MREKLANLDWEKWQNNTLVFLAPVGILYLVFLEANITKDGFQVADFLPTSEVIGGMLLYIINILLDFLKKYKAVEA